MSQRTAVALALTWLVTQSHTMRPDELPDATDHAVRLAGGARGRLHLITRDQRSLVALPVGSPRSASGAGRETVPVDGSIAGRAFRDTEMMPSLDQTQLWVPLLNGTERLGVLEVAVAADGVGLDVLRQHITPLAGLVAELVVGKGRYTDSFERARRAVPMGVAAELLWRQLPPLTFAADRFVVSAQLEPWDEVGGDAFDYSIDGDLLHLAVFDGMGHGLGATLLAGVALAAYRNARRAGASLVEMAAAIDEQLSAQFGEESFVTGVLAELDVSTGTISTLCAAHPAPLLVRDGRALGQLDSEPGLPLGFGGRDDTVNQAFLQPGDRLLMFSDGVVEARDGAGAFFGIDRLVDLLVRQEARRQTPPETLRRLVLAVLEHQQGTLQDDATLLMLEWAGDGHAVLTSEDDGRTGTSGSSGGRGA